MAGKRTINRLSQPPGFNDLADFWQEQIRTLGRKVFFVDTGGILKTLEADISTNDFFDSIVGVQLITSTYVLAEVVRRIVKSDYAHRFSGPSGERGSVLATYILDRWLSDYKVEVICPPKEVFDVASTQFARCSAIGCDLVDVISFVIVSGLEQKSIISPDRHFQFLGLQLLPG